MAFVVAGADVDGRDGALVGGKGASLGALGRRADVRVPAWFGVTTRAWRALRDGAPDVVDAIARLDAVGVDDPELAALSDAARAAVAAAPVPAALDRAIRAALADHAPDAAWAVRSSATAEDLPGASFAGQHDTWLDVVGADAVVDHVRRCMASLFTRRAVAYRARQGMAHGAVDMAVVVQRMLAPQASGVMFTADPLSGRRDTLVIEAVAGLGEALVSGRAHPDVVRIRDGVVIAREVRGHTAILSDHHALELTALGQAIARDRGAPQDLEWCLADGAVHLVQSRPITTLFPIPDAPDDARRVYLSVGHQQMMTDAMSPLGVSVFQAVALRPMVTAGGRLFVDVTAALGTAAGRAGLLAMAGRSDPLVGDALQTLMDRDPIEVDAAPAGAPPAAPPPAPPDPSLVPALMAESEAAVQAIARELAGLSGSAVFDAILRDVDALKAWMTDPRSQRVVMGGIAAMWWLQDHLDDWLGEQHAADTLSLSAPHNVTAEMGLALLDVADVIRAHPHARAWLEREGAVLDGLREVPGGEPVADALDGWLERYGMRCTGEIDVTRPRWRERPDALLPTLLAHVRRFAPGEAARRVQAGAQAADAKARDVLERLRALPDGEAKAEEAQLRIALVRAYAGFREYPKYGMICRFDVYRRALRAEAERLVAAGALVDPDDADLLTFHELREAARTGVIDPALLRERAAALRRWRALRPPRVLTSDGEALSGAYRRVAPPGALVGLAVSTGVVEGRARVVHDPADAALEAGDVLVTAWTDPSWTPLFVGIQGLVTEVGGLMTHGAVIAREYGLPAVVGVIDATTHIRDGQRVRVNGTDGYVELLDQAV